MVFDAWGPAVALPAIDAELGRRFPQKPEVAIATAAQHILAQLEAAWVAYSQHGAAAAFFDVVQFCDDCQMALPPEVSVEALELASAALSGLRRSEKARAPTPIARHRDALVKLGRALHLDAVLRDADFDKTVIDEVWAKVELMSDPVAAGLPASSVPTIAAAFLDDEAWAKIWLVSDPTTANLPASSDLTVAAAFALERMPEVFKRNTRKEQSVKPQAVYTDWREVRAAEVRPGRFYLPSKATAKRLGWEEISAAFAAIGHPPDALELLVA